MTMEIKLSRGYVAIVDDDDYERVIRFKWYATVHSNGKNIYAQRIVTRNGNSSTELMHRLIMRVPPGLAVMHVNNNGLDNRKENLRIILGRYNAIQVERYRQLLWKEP